MTSIIITVDTLDAPGAAHTWASALDAIEYCMPVALSLSVDSEWSGDVDTYKDGFRVRLSVDAGGTASAPEDALSAVEALAAAAEEVQDIEARASLLDGVAAQHERDGNNNAAAWCRQRAAQRRVDLPSARRTLDAAWTAYAASR